MNHNHVLLQQQWVPQPTSDVFGFFSDASNLEILTPRWLRFEVVTPGPILMHTGAVIDYRLRWHSIPLRWRTEIVCWEPPYKFEDLQVKGPYRLWHHTHTFESVNGGTLLSDRVEYGLPFGPLGGLAHALSVRRNVIAIFEYRRVKIQEFFGTDTRPHARSS